MISTEGMEHDKGAFGPNTAGKNSEGITAPAYGYTERWAGDAGEDPRKTSFDEFHSSTEEYGNFETAEASQRTKERPLMEDVFENMRKSHPVNEGGFTTNGDSYQYKEDEGKE